ncbi:unnamed protein product [Rhizopus stolonifer]
MSSIRRRATGSSPLNSLKNMEKENSNSSLLSENSSAAEQDEDVKTDVLFPRYKPSQDDHVDIEAFNQMVQHHARKLSTGTLQLSKLPSRQHPLYSKYVEPIGTIQNLFFNLEQFLTEEGQNALESVVGSKGWWVDVMRPTVEEMRIISKVKNGLIEKRLTKD